LIVTSSRTGAREVKVHWSWWTVWKYHFSFSGLRFESDNRIAEEVVSFTIAAVVITGRTAEHGVNDSALRIQCHVETPVVDAGSIFPAVVLPGFVTDFARLRDGMEFPYFLSRHDIECARVSRLVAVCVRERWRRR
jgi:hypothetical protein